MKNVLNVLVNKYKYHSDGLSLFEKLYEFKDFRFISEERVLEMIKEEKQNLREFREAISIIKKHI